VGDFGHKRCNFTLPPLNVWKTFPTFTREQLRRGLYGRVTVRVTPLEDERRGRLNDNSCNYTQQQQQQQQQQPTD